MIFENRYRAWEYLATSIKNKLHDLSNTILVGVMYSWTPVSYQTSLETHIPTTFFLLENYFLKTILFE